jgi:hypothetical protein
MPGPTAGNFGSNFIRSTGAASLSLAISSNGKYQVIASVTANYVYVSSNYGQTWTSAGITDGMTWAAMSSSGKYQSVCGATYFWDGNSNTAGYIWISSNYGSTWTRSTSAGNRSWTSISMSSNGQYQTAVVVNNYIYVSSDYGITWTARNTSVSSVRWSCVSVSASGQYQIAGIGKNGSPSGQIWMSTDYGLTWNILTNSPNTTWTSLAMSASGQYQVCTANSITVYLSRDYGNTYTLVYPDSNFSNSFTSIRMSASGQYLAAVGYGGTFIWVSTNYGNSWFRPVNNGTSISDVAVSASGNY